MAAARRTRDEADQGLGETVNDTHAAAQRNAGAIAQDSG